MTLTYEEFMDFLRQEGERRATQGGLMPIPEIRPRVTLSGEAFDEYVLRLHAERRIHLLSHVESDTLPDLVKNACIPHSSGALLYWIRWL